MFVGKPMRFVGESPPMFVVQPPTFVGKPTSFLLIALLCLLVNPPHLFLKRLLFLVSLYVELGPDMSWQFSCSLKPHHIFACTSSPCWQSSTFVGKRTAVNLHNIDEFIIFYNLLPIKPPCLPCFSHKTIIFLSFCWWIPSVLRAIPACVVRRLAAPPQVQRRGERCRGRGRVGGRVWRCWKSCRPKQQQFFGGF